MLGVADHAAFMGNKENASTHATTLVVPAAAWHAMQAQLAALQDSQQETKAYLRATLRLEHKKRERSASRLQAAWRGAYLRSWHPLACRLARWRAMRSRQRSLCISRCHLAAPPLPPATAGLARPVVVALRVLQRCARGFVVRRRVARWRAQTAAARRVQAAARGWRSRRRHGAALQQSRLAARVARLEKQLEAERRTRVLHEQFLRRLGEAVKGLAARAPPADAEQPL